MRRFGLALGTLGLLAAAAACGSGSANVPSAPAQPLSGAAADHQRLDLMRLRLDDLGPNWRREAPSLSGSASKCDPHPKDVTISAGSWKSRGVDFGFGTTAQVHSDAIVFASADDAQKVVAANMSAGVIKCVKQAFMKQLKDEKSFKLLGISTTILKRHKVADGLSAIRLTLNLAKGKKQFKFFVDAFLLQQDRALAEFTYMNAFRPAPTSTEYTLAEAIAQRGALAQ